MTLDGEVVQNTLGGNSELSKKDIKKISNFVKNNSESLSLISDMRMDFSDFKEYFMIEGSELISVEEKNKLHNEIMEYLNNFNEGFFKI